MPPFNNIHISSHLNMMKVKMKGGLGWMTKYRDELARFVIGSIFLVCMSLRNGHQYVCHLKCGRWYVHHLKSGRQYICLGLGIN